MLLLGAVMDTVLFWGSRASLFISSRVSTESFCNSFVRVVSKFGENVFDHSLSVVSSIIP